MDHLPEGVMRRDVILGAPRETRGVGVGGGDDCGSPASGDGRSLAMTFAVSDG